jgi:hypothetical protein
VRRPLAVLLLGVACGGSSDGDTADAAADGPAAADAGPEAPYLGPDHELELLPAQGGLEYNHSNEVQVAVSGQRVAAAYLNLHFVSADDFATDDTFIRTLGVAVSEDGGETFGAPVAAAAGRQPTDPNIRVDPDGVFWLATFDFDTIGAGGQGIIARSDDAVSWTKVVDGENFGDKNWMAIDPASGEVFVGAVDGWWRIDGDAITRDATPGAQFVGGYAAGGEVALTQTTTGVVTRWDGAAPPVADGAPPAAVGPTFYHTVSMPLGPTADGGEWFLRSTGDTTAAPLMLFVAPASGANSDVGISGPDALTFLPAAAVDGEGRIHIVYYDSSGGAGRVLYTHSTSSDFTAGFTEPLVVDDSAVPADFFPDIDTPSGARRVREYIDIQVVGSRAWIAWTHAPIAPSRVHVRFVQFE